MIATNLLDYREHEATKIADNVYYIKFLDKYIVLETMVEYEKIDEYERVYHYEIEGKFYTGFYTTEIDWVLEKYQEKKKDFTSISIYDLLEGE